MGGWWGTKTVLSDHPRLFWLQQHSDKEPTTTITIDQDKTTYFEYPTQSGQSVSISALDIIQSMTNGTVQLGSQQGLVRSNATYKTVELQKADGSKESLYTNYSPKGNAFEKNVKVDFSAGDKIYAEIMLPETTSGAENVFSIGDDISKWGQHDASQGQDADTYDRHNMHFYWLAGSGLEIDYVDKDGYCREYRSASDIKVSEPLKLTFSKEGLTVENNYSTETKYDKTETTTSVAPREDPASSNGEISKVPGWLTENVTGLKIGNEQNKNHGNLPNKITYNSVVLKTADGTSKDLVQKGLVLEGNTYESSSFNVNFADGESVEADITLENGGVGNSIFSLGTDVGAWNTSSNTIHVYWQSSNELLIHSLGSKSGGASAWPASILGIKGNHIKLIFSKDGVKVTDIVEVNNTVTTGFQSTYYQPTVIEYNDNNTGKINMSRDTHGIYTVAETGGNPVEKHITYNKKDDYPEKVTDNTKQVYIASSIIKDDSSYQNEGHFIGYADASSSKRLESDCGIFVDRQIEYKDRPTVTQWNIDYLDKTNGICKLSLSMPYNITDGEKTADGSPKTYYLEATNSVVHGLEIYESDKTKYNYPNEGSVKADAVDLVSISGDVPVNAQWKLIPLTDYRNLLNELTDKANEVLDITYVMSDPDFNRENGELKDWKTDGSFKTVYSNDEAEKAEKSQLVIGVDNCYKTYTSQVGYEGAWAGSRDERACFSRYMNVTIQKGGHGTFSQDLKIYRSGWYEIRCQGKSNVGAKLFAEFNGRYISIPLKAFKDNGEDSYSDFYHKSQWPYYESLTQYNAGVAMNDENVSTISNYTNSVRIYVADSNISIDNPGTITVGINVPEHENNTSDWTYFDSFRFLYGGKPVTPNLVLDEDKTNLDYIDNGIADYAPENGVILRLHRTFQKNLWNTIMLPVDLTKQQFYNLFGKDAMLAYLKEISSTNVVQCYTVKTNIADNDVFLKAYMPYLIKPTVSAGSDTDSYSVQIQNNTDGQADITVSIEGGEHPYFYVSGVKLEHHKNVTPVNEKLAKFYDFKNGKYAGLTAKPASYIYTVEATQDKFGVAAKNDANGNEKFRLTSYATLCKTYDDASAAKNQVLSGRPDLTDGNSFYYQDGKMTLNPKKRVFGLKGLRAWFVYSEPSAASAKINNMALSVDGVLDATTGISEVVLDSQPQLQGKFANGVYNMNGQLVSREASSLQSLPAGMYIVNGKKLLVK